MPPRIYLTSAAAVSAVDKAKKKAAEVHPDAPATEKANARWHGIRPDVADSVGYSGRVFSILRVPPEWLRARVDGQVIALTPTMALLGAAFDGRKIEAGERKASRGRPGLSFSEYAKRLFALWPPPEKVAPGALRFGRELTEQQAAELRAVQVAPADGPACQVAAKVVEWDSSTWHGPLGAVEDGDTLVCTCGMYERCHRIPAAERLAAAGWDVVLDGQEFDEAHRGMAWVQMNESALARGGTGWFRAPSGAAVHVLVDKRRGKGSR